MDNQVEIQLNPKEILQKQFKSKMRGYDSEEVDAYLDAVIKDYQAYQEALDKVNAENTRLFNKVEELNKQLNASETIKPEAKAPQPTAAATNYDILKRLSNLERHVFGAKLSDQNQTRGQIHSQNNETNF